MILYIIYLFYAGIICREGFWSMVSHLAVQIVRSKSMTWVLPCRQRDSLISTEQERIDQLHDVKWLVSVKEYNLYRAEHEARVISAGPPERASRLISRSTELLSSPGNNSVPPNTYDGGTADWVEISTSCIDFQRNMLSSWCIYIYIYTYLWAVNRLKYRLMINLQMYLTGILFNVVSNFTLVKVN